MFFVKNDGLVFTTEFSKARFQPLANGPKRARHFAQAVNVAVFTRFLRLNTGNGRGLGEEFFNDLRHQAAFFRFGGFADDGGKIQFALGQAFQGGIGDALQPIRVHLLNDALFDEFFGHLIAGVHVPNHFLQLVRGEHVAQNIEHLACFLGIEVFFRGLHALKYLLHDPAFPRIGRNEIQDQTVLLLAVTVDAAHALFKPDKIPGNIVIDHQPAELKVDAFAGGFGGDKHLGGFAKFAFGKDA